jgi:hypothetical protein
LCRDYGDTNLALEALRRAYVDMRGATRIGIWHPIFAELRKDPAAVRPVN